MIFQKLAFSIVCLTLVSCSTNTKNSSAFFRNDPVHSGFYNTRGVDSLTGPAWVFKTNGRIFSSPVIASGRLFIGSDDGFLYALEARNGKLLWKFRTGGRVSSTPAVYEQKVAFISFDGFVYCLDQMTGKEIWKFKTAGEKVFSAPGIHGMPEKDRNLDDPWDMFLSSPVVANGILYVGCGEGEFYAIDASNGNLRWSFKTGGVIHSSPAYANKTVCFGSWDSYLYALNSEDGSLKWKFKTGTDTVYFNQVGFQSSPAVYNGVVYSGCRDAHVWAIEAETGDLKWKYYNNGSWVISSPAVHNDTLYYLTSDTHKVNALSAASGRLLFSGDCRTYGFSSPTVAGGKIYTGTFGGSLMALDAKTGTVAWEYRTPAARENSDSILTANGEFNYARIFSSNTYEANLEAMNRLYSVGSILSTPVVHDGMAFFGSTDSCVYALH